MEVEEVEDMVEEEEGVENVMEEVVAMGMKARGIFAEFLLVHPHLRSLLDLLQKVSFPASL